MERCRFVARLSRDKIASMTCAGTTFGALGRRYKIWRLVDTMGMMSYCIANPLQRLAINEDQIHSRLRQTQAGPTGAHTNPGF